MKRIRRTFGQPTGRKPTSPRRKAWLNSPGRQQKYILAKIGWMQLFFGREQVAKYLAGTMTHSSAVEETEVTPS